MKEYIIRTSILSSITIFLTILTFGQNAPSKSTKSEDFSGFYRESAIKLKSAKADQYSIDFESEVEWTFDFLPWTVNDVDQLSTYGITGYTFPHNHEPMAYIVFNPATTSPPMTGDPEIQPHSGAQFGACMASVPDGGQGNDDWFISDQVLISGSGASFNFWAKSYSDLYGLERFNIGVSNSGNSPSDFTIISAPPYVEAPMSWTEYNFDLSAYNGQYVYVAIQCVSFDAFIFMIDDLLIDPGAGSTSNCDDFDSYTSGNLLCPQSSLWTTWDDNPGGPYDGYVSSSEYFSPSNSLSVDEAVMETDVVYDLGQTTAGIWDISLEIFVPSGGYGGYYNVMQDMELFGSSNEWGFQAYFESDGTGYYYDADFNQTNFSYQVGTWNNCKLQVDLDASWASYFVNGNLIGQWQWDIAGPNKLGVINIYAAASGGDSPKFYVDDVCFDSPAMEPDIDVNPDSLTINQQTKNYSINGSGGGNYIENPLDQPHVENILLVKFKDNVLIDKETLSTNYASINSLLNSFNALRVDRVFADNNRNTKQKQQYGLFSIYSIEFSQGVDLSKAIYQFSKDPYIVYAEPDYIYQTAIVPTDPLYPDQWGMNNTGQAVPYGGGGTVGTPGADINAENAWDIQTGSSSVIISIIDEGVDLTHPEFTGRLLSGYDFFDNDPDPSPVGDGAHGTACAGVAAAANDGVGVVGVAWDVMILPVRVLGPSGGSSTQVANGITFSADEGADVLSLSLGSNGFSSTMESAVNYAYSLNAIVLGAAGNDNTDNGILPFYPACYSNCISVGALSPCNDRKTPSTCDNEGWWGSNYGGDLDFLAPGVRIFTTDITGSAGYSSTNYTTTFNGTSSACPVAAGIAALLRSENPSLSNTEIWNIMQNTSVDLGASGYDDDTGYGRLDAYEALLEAGGGAPNNSFDIDNVGNAILTINSITDDQSWLSTSGYPSTPFTIDPGNGQNIIVDIDWNLLGGSQQTGIITISSDDPDEPSVTVTVTAIPGPTPDLIIQNQQINPNTVAPGDSINASCEVYNNGNATAESSTLKYYLSIDQYYDTTDTYLGSDAVDSIQAGSSSSQNEDVIIPSTTTEGIYYVLFYADADDDVMESDEENNVSSSLLTVDAPPSPYLTVEPPIQNVSYSQGYFVASVESNVAWEVFEDCPWITCDPMSGQNNDSFVVVHDLNNTGSIRTYTITVSGEGVSDNLTVVQDYVTSLPEDLISVKVTVFPNPFSESVRFDITIPEKSTISLLIYNYLGELVDIEEVNIISNNHSITWSRGNLPDGIYFYSIRYKDNKISGKLVKAR